MHCESLQIKKYICMINLDNKCLNVFFGLSLSTSINYYCSPKSYECISVCVRFYINSRIPKFRLQEKVYALKTGSKTVDF